MTVLSNTLTELVPSVLSLTWFHAVLAFVILQRLFEQVIAKRNAAFMRSIGGYEVGSEHYPYIVAVHMGFFLSLFAEVYARGLQNALPSAAPLTVFLVVQFIRAWCLLSLGKFWNTRIIVLPGSEPVVHGPYRYMRHPNYMVVVLELLALPMAFGAVITAAVFSVLNIFVLRERIRVEEAVLCKETGYEEAMKTKWRLLGARRRSDE
ncbi:isoprenylcysteine carboxyl methyltransferase family protein [Brevibacillus dissolubilis]|uniref:isoprenylcysteine carboxyl methyltransferase family protein n=1 Tax=Brevibacillus dissolubilis TaxID=1844116 RepID=UPI001116FB52|nr:isoprenylcysteine carboxylmethyltransferase family protein [Brevibacillus dissolubilis]